MKSDLNRQHNNSGSIILYKKFIVKSDVDSDDSYIDKKHSVSNSRN